MVGKTIECAVIPQKTLSPVRHIFMSKRPGFNGVQYGLSLHSIQFILNQNRSSIAVLLKIQIVGFAQWDLIYNARGCSHHGFQVTFQFGSVEGAAHGNLYCTTRSRKVNNLGSALQQELMAAIALAEQAGNILLEYYSASAEIEFEWKGKNNPVTAADRAASRFLVNEIQLRYPEDVILSEEEPDDRKRL